MVVAAYVAQAPEITIVDGVVCMRAKSNGKALCWHMPVKAFREGVSAARRTLDRYDGGGGVVPIR